MKGIAFAIVFASFNVMSLSDFAKLTDAEKAVVGYCGLGSLLGFIICMFAERNRP